MIHQQGEQSVTAPPTTEGVGLKGRQALHPTDLSHPSQSQRTFHITARRSEASNCSFSKLHLQKAGSTRPAGCFDDEGKFLQGGGRCSSRVVMSEARLLRTKAGRALTPPCPRLTVKKLHTIAANFTKEAFSRASGRSARSGIYQTLGS